MKIDINVVHIIAIIALTIVCVTLAITHQTTILASIINWIIGMLGVSFVPAALRVKTDTEKGDRS